MASHLDLEEQEQLDQLKAFWKRYGTAITWVLTLILAAFASYNAYNWWQRDQAGKAMGLFEQLQSEVEAGELDKVTSALAVLKDKYPTTVVTAQAAFLTAKLQRDKSQDEAARTTLAWVAEHASEAAYRDMANLRLAGLQIDAKQYEAAAKSLAAVKLPDYAGLQADRRGDLAQLQNQRDVAKAEYLKAHAVLNEKLDYRRIVEAKLATLGVAVPETPAKETAK